MIAEDVAAQVAWNWVEKVETAEMVSTFVPSCKVPTDSVASSVGSEGVTYSESAEPTHS